MRDYHEYLKEVLVSEEALQARIAELGKEITRDYQGEELLLVCILRGGVMFLTDLMRQIDLPHMIEFMAVSSYGVGKRATSGQARITLDLNTDIKDKHVIIVEDIIDSGHTLAAVVGMLESRNPASLHICTLLDKSTRREVVVPIRYTGFAIEDKFVFGYGLDLDEYYRDLPFIGVVDLEKFENPE
ncbi:MAG: hypoxanthine phosphoribosyltransferase [Anaerolineaceae bacterium]|jgi:hypoxanthine phosphoribosyltransferase|nr:hypoxanthine phosphoribosyltransferase [Anaerolineaceae bacterium]